MADTWTVPQGDRDKPQSAEDFILADVTINTDRFLKSLNITNVTAEINIFESIYNQYLTGSILIMDDANIFGTMDIQGTERVRLAFKYPGSVKEVAKNFVITNIEKTFKQNDYTQIVLLSIVEDFAYYNNLQQISKAYSGRGEDIIKNILLDNLKKQYEDATVTPYRGFNTFKQSFQDPFKYIIPYTTPLDAVKTILRKMTTDHGAPYFCYSTLSSQHLILADLETILQRAPINTGKPFTFSQSTTNSTIDKTPYTIYNYESTNYEDTLLLSQLGAIGSLHSALNLSTGEKTLEHIDINEVFRQLTAAGVFNSQQNKILLDNKFKADPNSQDQRLLGDFNSRYYHQVAGNTYPYQPNLKNWTEEKDIYTYKLRIYKYAIEQFMQKNIVTLTIPGLLFISGSPQLEVGNQIEIAVNKNIIPNPETQSNEVKDPKKSGNFVILSKRHVFKVTDQSHVVTLECSRIADQKG